MSPHQRKDPKCLPVKVGKEALRVLGRTDSGDRVLSPPPRLWPCLCDDLSQAS